MHPLNWRSRVRYWVGPLPVLDVVIAGLFLVSAAISATFLVRFGPYPVYVLNTVLEVALAVVAAGRRRYAIGSFVATYVLLAAYGLLHALSPVNLGLSPIIFAAPVALWAVTRWAPGRVWGVLGLVLGVVGAALNPAVLGSPTIGEFSPARLVAFGVPALVVVAVAYAWPAWLRSTAEQQYLQVQNAVQAQRLELSRELHDVVGHGLTAIKVRAQIARYQGDHPDRALGDIVETAEESLADVRALVDALRDGQERPHPLPDVAELLHRARTSGLQIQVDAPADEELPAAWPLRHRLVFTRLIQEILTNMLRHGDGTGRLDIDVDPASFTVTATNPVRAEQQAGGSHGLAGLHERLGTIGGELEHHVTDGHFTVSGRCAW